MTDGPLAQLFAATETSAAHEHAEPKPKRAAAPRKKVADAVPAPAAAMAGTPSRSPRMETIAESSQYLAVIRVVGVGGGGCNAIERMIDADVRGVEFIAINTDMQQLENSNAQVRLHVGAEITGGLGSGADPDVGRSAAEASYDHIKHVLKGSDMVFVTCGEGGGTGTGAAPVVCRAAREVGALVVAIVTTPFSFEGTQRRRSADSGMEKLRDAADTTIVIPNNRLLEVLNREVSMIEAFRVADDVLRQGVQGVSDLITMPGLINVDFADVRTIMTESGSALMGIGFGTGENRAVEAAESALGSPLIDQPASGAGAILLSVSGGDDLSLHEVTEAAEVIKKSASPDAEIIFGATVDSRLTGQVWVTVVATRFPGQQRTKRNGMILGHRDKYAADVEAEELDLPSFLR
jgi:cell division protein FtsZ